MLELRESHRYQQNKGTASQVSPGDVVIVHDQDQPRGLWKVGRIESTIKGADENIRGVLVKVSNGGRTMILHRPVQRLYHLRCEEVILTKLKRLNWESPSNISLT